MLYYVENGSKGWKNINDFGTGQDTIDAIVFGEPSGLRHHNLVHRCQYLPRTLLSPAESFHHGVDAKKSEPGNMEKVEAAIRSHYNKYQPEGKSLDDKIERVERSKVLRKQERKKSMNRIPTNK